VDDAVTITLTRAQADLVLEALTELQDTEAWDDLEESPCDALLGLEGALREALDDPEAA
jgi:hypothetical protein